MKKRIRKCMAVFLALACVVAMTACGGDGDGGGGDAACTIKSEDGKYEFKIADNWTCWISEAGSSEKLAEGSFSIREENSAVTIIVNDEILEMDNGDYTYKFTYGNDELGIEDAVFEVVRHQVLSDLDAVGVILMTDDIGSGDGEGAGAPGGVPGGEAPGGAPGGEASEGEAPGGAPEGEMGAPGGEASGGAPEGEMGAPEGEGGAQSGNKLGFSMTPGVILWNDGTIQLNIIKVQASAQYTYSKEEGFKVTQTERDKAIYGLLESEDNGDTLVLKYTDITANLPFGMSKTGSVTFHKADLEAALQLD